LAFPRRARLSWVEVRQQLGRGSWISVGQVAQVLLSGTDLVVVGKLLGPEAIVPYACTGKLIAMLANQPQLFMQMALPALSELRGSAARDRLFQVSRGMTQLMLLASGAIVAVVLVVNAAFVGWWVGESRFGGTALTVLLLAGMLVRHVNVTMVYTLFCFGHERRLALTNIADGLVATGINQLKRLADEEQKAREGHRYTDDPPSKPFPVQRLLGDALELKLFQRFG